MAINPCSPTVEEGNAIIPFILLVGKWIHGESKSPILRGNGQADSVLVVGRELGVMMLGAVWT